MRCHVVLRQLYRPTRAPRQRGAVVYRFFRSPQRLNSATKNSASVQQRIDDAEPFRIEWLSANEFARSAVPIVGVALIAFLAMQVGMHPRTVPPFILLCEFVRSLPVALGVPPQSGERVRESGWRSGRCQ